MKTFGPRRTRANQLLWLMIAFFGLAIHNPSPVQALTPEHLMTDLLLQPNLRVVNGYPAPGYDNAAGQQTVIANKQPVFGWELASNHPQTTQSAYRIIVSETTDSPARDAESTWDSGKVDSAESINVPYAGNPLKPDTPYSWRVMVWDQDGTASGWSGPAHFVTASQLFDYKTAVYPLVKTDETATDISESSGVIRLDFGKASFAQLKMTLTSRDGGETLTVRLGEAIHPDGRINRKPGGTIRYAEYKISLQQGRRSYALQFKPDPRNTGPQAIKMPAAIGEVYPFRYCEIEGYREPLAPQDVVRATVHYPFNEYAAHFESSDPTLNAVWELCKYSIKATSFAGTYIDGDRERIPYEADAYINQLCHYAVDKEYTMARRSHEYLIHHATWPTEWILQSVLMAYNDYLYTGDIRSAAHHYNDLKAKLLLPLRTPNGLLSTVAKKQTPALLKAIHFKGKALRDIVDWPHSGSFGMEGLGETDGFVFTDYNTVVNAFHYKALQDMTSLASALGRDEDSAEFAAKARETYNAFQSLLWDDSRGVYRDGIATDHASLHANMMALAFGLVPREHRPAVMEFVRSRGMACSVYGSQFLMDAIYDAGDAHYGLSLLTSRDDRSWYNMIRAGSTITMEAWDNKFKPNQDWNHAWGAVPANIIPRKLMGIEPLTPGWKEFRVRPQTASLQWANIRVPTIRGEVQLRYKQTNQEHHYTVTVPTNTTAHIEVPLQSENAIPHVTMNKQEVKLDILHGRAKLPPVHGGTYHVRVTY